jgi:phage/plasmid-associated DNA primase
VAPKDGTDTPSASLYKAYSDWCRDNNEHPLPSKLFSPEMERRGYVKKRRGGGMVWVGIVLMASDGW